MTEATSDSLGEVLVDETAPTGTDPTALTTYGWLNDSTAPYVDSGGKVSGAGNTLSVAASPSLPRRPPTFRLPPATAGSR